MSIEFRPIADSLGLSIPQQPSRERVEREYLGRDVIYREVIDKDNIDGKRVDTERVHRALSPSTN